MAEMGPVRHLLLRCAALLTRLASAGPWKVLTGPSPWPRVHARTRARRFESTDDLRALMRRLERLAPGGMPVVATVADVSSAGARDIDAWLAAVAAFDRDQRRRIAISCPGAFAVVLTHRGLDQHSRAPVQIRILEGSGATNEVVEAIARAVDDETVPCTRAEEREQVPLLEPLSRSDASARRHERDVAREAAKIGARRGAAWGALAGISTGIAVPLVLRLLGM